MLTCLWPTLGAAQASPGHCWLPSAGYWEPAHREVAHGDGQPMKNPTQEKRQGLLLRHLWLGVGMAVPRGQRGSRGEQEDCRGPSF